MTDNQNPPPSKNLLASALLVPQCLHGHGGMEPIAGLWALGGVERSNYGVQPKLLRTDQAFLVRIYRCKTCGAVELYDHDFGGQ